MSQCGGLPFHNFMADRFRSVRKKAESPTPQAAGVSFWLDKNANWPANQARMRCRDCSDVRNLIAWRGVGTSTGHGFDGVAFRGSVDL